MSNRHRTKRKLRPIMGSRTFATMNKTVIVKRIDPDTGEEVIVRTEKALPAKKKLKLDKRIE